MIKGWFVGDFEPSVLRTNSAEIAVKKIKAGTKEDAHFHKIATEITYVLEGEVILCNQHLFPGDIAVINPLETNEFIALTDAVLVVVKVPGAQNDKFILTC
jgi:quercetin dioxygenase-like cupin family protein